MISIEQPANTNSILVLLANIQHNYIDVMHRGIYVIVLHYVHIIKTELSSPNQPLVFFASYKHIKFFIVWPNFDMLSIDCEYFVQFIFKFYYYQNVEGSNGNILLLPTRRSGRLKAGMFITVHFS